MSNTSHSLLENICAAEAGAWDRLVEIYTPVIRQWLTRYEIQATDRDDLVQDVLLTLSRELPNFQHNGRVGAFRAWLRQILVNRLRAYFGKKQKQPAARGETDFVTQLQQLEDPHSELSRIWAAEHDRQLVLRILEFIKSRFEANTVAAFRRTVLDEANAELVAEELGMTKNAVIIAKCRVLKTLRREARGLIDE